MDDILVTLGAGSLFGAAAGLLLVANGRVAGISGIAAGALGLRRGDFAWRVAFLLGLLVGGGVALRLVPDAFAREAPRSLPWLVVSGLCIGFGARLANGCTSGHGVCGVGRLALRSAVATAVFTAAGAITRVAWVQLGGRMNRDRLPIAALAGFAIALALAFGQLTRPEVVIGWVDFFGSWNPRMMIFMLAATVVYQAFTRGQAWRQRRAGGPEACAPVKRRIDGRLLTGASIFGIGWAIAGVCPGPALVSLGTGAPWAAVFVVAMGVGLSLAKPQS